MKAIEKMVKKEKGKLIKLDGIKLKVKNGFILFRKSGTEPLIRCYIEGLDEKTFGEMKILKDKIVNSTFNY